MLRRLPLLLLLPLRQGLPIVVDEVFVDAIDPLHKSLPLGMIKSGALCMREVYVCIEKAEVASCTDQDFAHSTMPACLVLLA